LVQFQPGALKGDTVVEFLKWNTENLDVEAKSEMFYDERMHDLNVLHAFQKNRCAICGRNDNNLQMDHCHESGFIRGLLCRSCNVMEGKSDFPEYEAYRNIYPTKILNLKLLYRKYASWNSSIPWFNESELNVDEWSDEKCYKIVAKMTRSHMVNLQWLSYDEFNKVIEKALNGAIQKGAERMSDTTQINNGLVGKYVHRYADDYKLKHFPDHRFVNNQGQIKSVVARDSLGEPSAYEVLWFTADYGLPSKSEIIDVNRMFFEKWGFYDDRIKWVEEFEKSVHLNLTNSDMLYEEENKSKK
jgi:hypothetical protein